VTPAPETGVIRHVVLFCWTKDATDDQLRAVIEGLTALPGAIPEIRSYRFGADLGLVAGNWDFALVAEFDSVDDWETYRDHPLHQALIAERIRPVLADRAAVQLLG
jgi:hypothetical protein